MSLFRLSSFALALMLAFHSLANSYQSSSLEFEVIHHGDELVLRWDSTPGQSYQLYHRETLEVPWKEVAEEPILADSQHTLFHRPVTGSMGFYMVQEMPGETAGPTPARESTAVLDANLPGWKKRPFGKAGIITSADRQQEEEPLASSSPFLPRNHTGVNNDHFRNRISISGTLPQVRYGDNVFATRETGERGFELIPEPSQKSVWWSWRATQSGSVAISTEGSDFDTLLGVYRGNSVSSLSVVAENDDDTETQQLFSRVVFYAETGTTYQIRVDGYPDEFGAESGDIKLTITGDSDGWMEPGLDELYEIGDLLKLPQGAEYIFPTMDDWGNWDEDNQTVVRARGSRDIEVINNFTEVDFETGMELKGSETDLFKNDAQGLKYASTKFSSDLVYSEWIEGFYATLDGDFTGELKPTGGPVVIITNPTSGSSQGSVAADYTIRFSGVIRAEGQSLRVTLNMKGRGTLTYSSQVTLFDQANPIFLAHPGRIHNFAENDQIIGLDDIGAIPIDARALDMSFNIDFEDHGIESLSVSVGGQRMDPWEVQDLISQFQGAFEGSVLEGSTVLVEERGLLTLDEEYPLMPDLRVEIEPSGNWPASIVSGSNETLNVEIKVSNEGFLNIPARTTIDVDLYAVDENGNVEYLQTLEGQSVGGLRPGASKTLRARAQLPPGLGGRFSIGAHVDANQDVWEEVESNNSRKTIRTVEVAEGYVDLALSISERGMSMPGSVVAGDGARITLPIEITNLGNVPVPSGKQLALYVDAVNEEWGEWEEIDLKENVSVGGLRPEATKKITLTVELPPGMPQNVYNMGVYLADLNDIEEVYWDDDIDNNWYVTQQFIEVAEGYVDLSLSISDRGLSMPASVVAGDGASITLPIEITNLGNVRLPVGKKVVLKVDAVLDFGWPVETLQIVENISVSGLRPGASKSQRVTVQLPPGLPQDVYFLEVDIGDPDWVEDEFDEFESGFGSFHDKNPENNSITTDQSIEVAEGYVDLALSISERGLSMPASVVAGDGARITLPVEITNLGNVPAERGQKVGLRFEASPANGFGEAVVLEMLDVSVSSLRTQASKSQRVTLQLPAGLPENTYILKAVLEGAGAGNRVANDVAQTAQSIEVADGYVDLSLSISERGLSMPTSVVAGDGARITLPVEITNLGNVALPAGKKVVLEVEAAPSDGWEYHTLALVENISVSGLRPGASKSQRVTVQLPPGLPQDVYQLEVELADPDVVDEWGYGWFEDRNEENNSVASEQSIEVAEGYVDLDLAIASRGFRISVPVEITNHGNVNAPRDATQPVWVRITPSDAFGDEISPVNIRQDVSVANLRPGATKKQTLQIQLPSEFEGTLYSIDISIGPWGD